MIVEMKKRSNYPLDNDPGMRGGRGKFHYDIHSVAFNRSVPVATVLGEFFKKNPGLSKRDMGSYALYTSSQGMLTEGCLVLVHALNLTPEKARQENILEYFNLSINNPIVFLFTTIDTMLGWPLGTICPHPLIDTTLVQWLST